MKAVRSFVTCLHFAGHYGEWERHAFATHLTCPCHAHAPAHSRAWGWGSGYSFAEAGDGKHSGTER